MKTTKFEPKTFLTIVLLLLVVVSAAFTNTQKVSADGNNGSCTQGEAGCEEYHHIKGNGDCDSGWFFGRPAGNGEWESGGCPKPPKPTEVIPPTAQPTDVIVIVPSSTPLPPTAQPTDVIVPTNTSTSSTAIPTNTSTSSTAIPTDTGTNSTKTPIATITTNNTTTPTATITTTTASQTPVPTWTPFSNSATPTTTATTPVTTVVKDPIDWSKLIRNAFGTFSFACGQLGWAWYCLIPLFLLFLLALAFYFGMRYERHNSEIKTSQTAEEIKE